MDQSGLSGLQERGESETDLVLLQSLVETPRVVRLVLCDEFGRRFLPQSFVRLFPLLGALLLGLLEGVGADEPGRDAGRESRGRRGRGRLRGRHGGGAGAFARSESALSSRRLDSSASRAL